MATASSATPQSIVWRVARGVTFALAIGLVFLLVWGLWKARLDGIGHGQIVAWFVEGCLGIAAFAYTHIRWPWMYGLWACLLVGALVTPPDPPSMLCVGVPLMIVYMLAIWRWKVARRKIPSIDNPDP